MEATTQEGVETTPEQEPETPVTQPPGESPESPEPEAPPKPGEAPAEPPADPEPDAGEAKVPENATRAGRKRASAKSQKAKPRGKAKPTDNKQTDKEKEEKKKLSEEFKTLQKQNNDRGHDTKMARRMRHVAEKLGRSVPKWALASSKAKDPDAPKRVDDPDLQLAHQMTAYATNGKVVDGKVIVGDVKFGANVSARQVKLMREQLKGKDILKFLHVSEAKLGEYARGKIKAVDLPQEARDAIKALNGKFDPQLKMWARKDAVIALFLYRERKSRKKAAPKEEREAVAA